MLRAISLRPMPAAYPALICCHVSFDKRMNVCTTSPRLSHACARDFHAFASLSYHGNPNRFMRSAPFVPEGPVIG